MAFGNDPCATLVGLRFHKHVVCDGELLNDIAVAHPGDGIAERRFVVKVQCQRIIPRNFDARVVAVAGEGKVRFAVFDRFDDVGKTVLTAVRTVHYDLEEIAARKVERDFIGVIVYLFQFLCVRQIIAESRTLQRLGDAAARNIPGIRRCIPFGKRRIIGNDQAVRVPVVHKAIGSARRYCNIALCEVEIFYIRILLIDRIGVQTDTAERIMPLAVVAEVLGEVIEHERVAGDKLVRIGVYVVLLVIRHGVLGGSVVTPPRDVGALDVNFQRRVARRDDRIAVAHERDRILHVEVKVFLLLFGVGRVRRFILIAPRMRRQGQGIIARLIDDHVRLPRVGIEEVCLSLEVPFGGGFVEIPEAALIFKIVVDGKLERIPQIEVERDRIFVDARLFCLGQFLRGFVADLVVRTVQHGIFVRTGTEDIEVARILFKRIEREITVYRSILVDCAVKIEFVQHIGRSVPVVEIVALFRRRPFGRLAARLHLFRFQRGVIRRDVDVGDGVLRSFLAAARTRDRTDARQSQKRREQRYQPFFYLHDFPPFLLRGEGCSPRITKFFAFTRFFRR